MKKLMIAVCLTMAGVAFAAHEIVIDERVLTPDEGLLLGNGDLSCSIYQNSDEVVFRFGKGDVWDRRLDFTGAPKPSSIDELTHGLIVEGWKTSSWTGQGVVATKQPPRDEARMKEVVGPKVKPLGNGPYPTPKPVGELHMRLPIDLPGPMTFTQRVIIEEGRLLFSAVWKNGVRVDGEAVVDPVENVFALKWNCQGWTELSRVCPVPPCYFSLQRKADPDVNEWAYEQSVLYPKWASIMDYQGKDMKPLPPPEVGVWNGRWGIEQGFYPDNLFPEGFRCRMTLLADKRFGEAHSHPRRKVMKDAVVTYIGKTFTTNGEVAVAVTTSRDKTLEAPKARTYADYAARAKAAGAAYWEKSGFAMPGDRELENLWYATYHARRCILRGGTVPPGLFFPSSLPDFSRWNGDYHANYNMHSIYWGDFTANRLDQADAWCDMMDFFVPVGRKIARDYYKARGIFVQLEGFPLLADDDYNGYLPLGRMTYMTGWAMTRHWQYWQYTRDRDWLVKRGYPYIKDCALFYLDYLKKAPSKDLPPNLNDGKYHAFPSVEGESGFSGDPMDMCDKRQVLMHVRHTLWAAIEAAKILNTDEDLRAQWQERLDNLYGTPTFKSAYEKHCYYAFSPEFGGNGTAYHPPCGEWKPIAPFDPVKNPRNRFQDSYYGHTIRDRIASVCHSNFIPARDWESYRKDIFDWAHPNGLVWGMAIQRWARTGGWTETLSCMAPYQDMLLQSWDGAIRIFPCWPMEKDVSFRNWRAQGAFLVSTELKGGEVVQFTVTSERGEDCLVWGEWTVSEVRGLKSERGEKGESGERVREEDENSATHHSSLVTHHSVATDHDEFGRLRFKTVPGGVYQMTRK